MKLSQRDLIRMARNGTLTRAEERKRPFLDEMDEPMVLICLGLLSIAMAFLAAVVLG